MPLSAGAVCAERLDKRAARVNRLVAGCRSPADRLHSWIPAPRVLRPLSRCALRSRTYKVRAVCIEVLVRIRARSWVADPRNDNALHLDGRQKKASGVIRPGEMFSDREVKWRAKMGFFAFMSELQPLSADLLIHLAGTLQIPLKGLEATIALLDEGSTVPFIARYRKESTGNLDEVQICAVEEKLLYFRELVSRKETILASIREQGKLTDELKARIHQTLDKSELEDLYLPYKPKRRTKAAIAREKGLEALAAYLWNQQPTDISLATF